VNPRAADDVTELRIGGNPHKHRTPCGLASRGSRVEWLSGALTELTTFELQIAPRPCARPLAIPDDFGGRERLVSVRGREHIEMQLHINDIATLGRLGGFATEMK